MTIAYPFTSEPFNSVMRVGCLVVYAAGLCGALGLLPAPYASAAVSVTAFVLAAHTAELLLLRRHLGLYAGPKPAAIVLALLFGSLHWFPLLEQRRRISTGLPPARD